MDDKIIDFNTDDESEAQVIEENKKTSQVDVKLESEDKNDVEKTSPNKKDKKQEEEPVNVKKEIISTIIYVAIVFALTFFIITFVGQRTKVDGCSMENTLQDGDNLIVDKISYRFNDPERFDIVILKPQGDPGKYYIKRIIGLPGETVYIDEDGNIFINGKVLEEHYGREIIINAGRASTPITLGEDEYFVLGDNRNNSSDSRFETVGNLAREDIIGKAVCRIYPLDSIRTFSNEE